MTIEELATRCVKAVLPHSRASGGGNGPVPTIAQIKRVARVLRLHLFLTDYEGKYADPDKFTK